MALRPEILDIILHMSAVMTCAIIGNFFLIFVILRGNAFARHRHSPIQILLLHNCVADLVFAFFSLGTEITTLFTYPEFHGSNIFCKMLRYIQVLPLYASPFLLVAISADRFQAICRPLSHYRGNRYRRPNMLAAIAWIMSLLCSIPQLFIWHKDDRNGRCGTVFGHSQSALKSFYVLWFAILAWLLPSIIAGFLYYRVCQTVWKSHLQLKNMSSLDDSAHGHKLSCHTKEYVAQLRKGSDVIQNQLTEFDRKRVQTVRLTLTIVTCNFFLWAPFCLMNVVQAFVPPNLIHPKIIIYVLVLGNLNSCVNPWIYVIFNRKIVKRAFLSLTNNAKEASRRFSNLTYSPNTSRLNSIQRRSHLEQSANSSSQESEHIHVPRNNSKKIRFSDSTLLRCESGNSRNQLDIPD